MSITSERGRNSTELHLRRPDSCLLHSRPLLVLAMTIVDVAKVEGDSRFSQLQHIKSMNIPRASVQLPEM